MKVAALFGFLLCTAFVVPYAWAESSPSNAQAQQVKQPKEAPNPQHEPQKQATPVATPQVEGTVQTFDILDEGEDLPKE